MLQVSVRLRGFARIIRGCVLHSFPRRPGGAEQRLFLSSICNLPAPALALCQQPGGTDPVCISAVGSCWPVKKSGTQLETTVSVGGPVGPRANACWPTAHPQGMGSSPRSGAAGLGGGRLAVVHLGPGGHARRIQSLPVMGGGLWPVCFRKSLLLGL